MLAETAEVVLRGCKEIRKYLMTHDYLHTGTEPSTYHHTIHPNSLFHSADIPSLSLVFHLHILKERLHLIIKHNTLR
jgi:hypothetical protein